MLDGDGVRLACYTDGDPGRPALVFIHGYPDTARVWDRLVERLATRFYCVRYDVRGAGNSERPRATSAYRLAHLERDLAAVINWISPARPVHLIGHDWGSIQGWEAATDPAMADRIATFTSLSGPCLDHLSHGLRRQWRHNRPGLWAQARRSWYIGFFHLPLLAPLAWRVVPATIWPAVLARPEGERLAVAPTWREDGRHGIKLYRANVTPRLRRPRRRPAVVPVHAIVARRDPFVDPAIAGLMDAWVEDSSVDEIDAGHWAIVTRATCVAEMIEGYIAERTSHESVSEPRAKP